MYQEHTQQDHETTLMGRKYPPTLMEHGITHTKHVGTNKINIAKQHTAQQWSIQQNNTKSFPTHSRPENE